MDDLTKRLVAAQTELAAQKIARAKLEGRFRAAVALIRTQQNELAKIQGSVSWPVVQDFWRWSARWFPYGTWKRRLYEATVSRLGQVLAGARSQAKLWRRSRTSQGRVQQLTQQPKSSPDSNFLLHCDEPSPNQYCGGVVEIKGWAAAASGIASIEIRLDGEKIGQANYGLVRPELGQNHPGFDIPLSSGFVYLWDSSGVEDGRHHLTISALSARGVHRELDIPIILDRNQNAAAYDLWICLQETGPHELNERKEQAETLSYRPLISIVVPVYQTSTKLLAETIESVRNQIYANWELCLVDGGSADPQLARLLADYAAQDSRIRIKALPVNQGIAATTNDAIALATGDFVGFLEHDDKLALDALYWVTELLQQHGDADLIYSDEDKLDLAGDRCEPFFKPDWSPDLLLSMNYVCHFLVVRRELLRDGGGFREQFDGSQAYDLVLRLMEKTGRIHHIPRVLYHWHQSRTSTAMSSDSKLQASTAACRAISDYLKRNKISGHVEPGIAAETWRVRYEIVGEPQVTLIVPTGGRIELLRSCLESVFAKTDYGNYDILLVDNSKSGDVQDFIASFPQQRAQLAYLDYRKRSFNFSALNNFAVQKTTAPLILFLNDDTEVLNGDWLTALVEHGQRPTVGAVGAKLLYPTGLIQHAGVVMGIYENSAHAFRHLPAESSYYFGLAQVIRNCSAVTAACMLTKRDLFLRLGGFNESKLAVEFQDPDYCLRVCRAGFAVVYTPYSVLVHHESVTKSALTNPGEVRYMRRKWANVIAHDPYYNPNLTRKAEDYSLRFD